MITFHGKENIKKKYVNRVIAHRKADTLVRGIGWENGKGCAVGCTLENYDHKAYETELGIPEWLARLEDTLFEGMSLDKSHTWPEKFLKAIKPGVDLEPVRGPFMVLILEHTLKSMAAAKYDEKANPKVKAAIDQSQAAVKQMIGAGKIGESAAWSAAWSAESAARSAAESAARSAESAAWSAARSAESAARSAARSAAWSAYDYYADELLKLLKGVKK